MRDIPESPSTTSPRERILDAAAAELAEHGLAGTRVDRIAARAGVNKAMLYYHVGDKQELYTAVLLRNFDRIAATLEAARTSRGTVSERLSVVITALVDVVTTCPEHPRIVLREVAAGGAGLPPDVLLRMLNVVGLVRELLLEGMENGELRRLDPLLTHLALVGMVVFMTSVRPLRERVAQLAPEISFPDPDLDLSSFISDLILNGLARRTTKGVTP